jgi:hypothetical protein
MTPGLFLELKRFDSSREPLRKTRTPETVQTVDRENPTSEQKQEQIMEPGHYLGIGR